MRDSGPDVRGLTGLVAAATLIASAAFTATVDGDVQAPTPIARTVAVSEPIAEPVELIAEDPKVIDMGNLVQLALAGDGYALTVWHEVDLTSPLGRWRLVAAVRSADGTWSAPQPVSDPFAAEYSALDVATAGPGAAVAVWNQDDGQGPPSVYTSLLTDDGSWTSPERVGAGTEPSVAMNADRVVLSWTGGNPTSTHVRTRPADSTGAWSPVRRFTGTLTSVSAAGGEGAAAVVWGNYFAGRLRVLYRGNNAGSWADPVGIPARVYLNDAPPAVTVDSAGRVVVVWMRGQHVYWTRRGLAGNWSKVAEVPGQVGFAGEYGWISAAVNGRGGVLARWITDGAGGTFAARYRPKRGWSRAEVLGPDRSRVFGATAGDPLLTGDGVAVVIGAAQVGLAWLSQQPGQPWSPLHHVASAGPAIADGFGRVAAAVVWDEGGLHFHRFRVPSTP